MELHSHAHATVPYKFVHAYVVYARLPQVDRLGRELLKQSTAFEQAGLDLEVLTNELELERRKNRDLPHEIRLAEAHKAEALEAKVGDCSGLFCSLGRKESNHFILFVIRNRV